MSFFSQNHTEINSDDWTITKKTTRTIKHENFSKMENLKVDRWALSLTNHTAFFCSTLMIIPFIITVVTMATMELLYIFSQKPQRQMTLQPFIIWVGSWRGRCLVTWFCYQLIEKPGNNPATLPCPTQIQFAINSLWPSDIIWHQESRSTLAQVMACCLTAPSHYLNQCWLMISEVLWQSPDRNFTENT